MQTMRYSPQDEQNLMVELWSPELANDPEAFVRFVFPWGSENTPLHKHIGPRQWQIDVLRQIRDHISGNQGKIDFETLQLAVSSGRGIGKSALVSWLVIWMLTTRIGSTVIVSANSESQLRSVTWGEVSKWVAMSINSHWWEVSATKLTPANWLASVVERDLSKGTRYWAAEGKLWSEENPDGYAGAHSHDGMMVIFDESSGIPSPIWDVAKGYFTEPILDRYWLAFSNPRRNDGYFFECFHSKRDFWKTLKVDSRTVEGTDKKIYDQIIAENGENSYQARVEVYGEFPLSGESQFIQPDIVDEAIKRKKYEDPQAPLIIGVDVARFGSDKTCIAVRKGRDLLELKKYSGLDTMRVVGEVISFIDKYEPDLTVIDEGGLGAGVVDRLLEQRFKVRGVNFGSKADDSCWGNKRTEIWGEMRDWLKIASIGSDTDNKNREDMELKSDLTGPQYKIMSDGATILEPKADMKKRGLSSPDGADAIAISFSYRVARHRNSEPLKNRPLANKSKNMLYNHDKRGAWMG